MPFYSDQMFYSRSLVPYNLGTASATGTGTAIGVAVPTLGNGVVQLPTFVRRTAITNVQVVVTVAPAAGFTGGVLSLTNGTNTFAVVNYGTVLATAGQVNSAVITTANSTFAAAAVPTGTLVGTCTSAGVLAGGFVVYFEQQELYA